MKDLSKMLEVKCDCSETIDWHELKDFQGGLKKRNDSDYEKMKTSILKYGLSFVVYYWNDGKNKYIIDGHNRKHVFEELEKEGYLIPPIPAIEVFAKDREEAKQKLLRLNSTYGQLSKESVLEFCNDIDLNFEEIALPDTVIDFTDAEEPQETEGDDEVPDIDEKEKPNSERGCMYELGNSILMCGDSTSAEDVARLMGGEKADMVFTDPPYNVNYADKNNFLNEADNGKRIQEDIENDHYSDDNECGEKLWKPAFSNCYENAKDKCSIYVTMPQGGVHMMMMMMMIKEAGWQVKHELIWVKNNHVLGRVDYYYKHEPILYGWKKGHKWYGKGKFDKSVWEIDKPLKCDLHPTMKPIELIENALLNSSEKNDLILDLFGGSGSTLIACEKNNRRARVMEIDPRYVDVIRKRWTKFAKENGLKIGSGGLE